MNPKVKAANSPHTGKGGCVAISAIVRCFSVMPALRTLSRITMRGHPGVYVSKINWILGQARDDGNGSGRIIKNFDTVIEAWIERF